MEYTYKIENYYPYESRIFVVYTPVDTAYEPLGAWIHVTADMTQEQIKEAVVSNAPLVKWAMPKSSAVMDLIGLEETVVAVSAPVNTEVLPAKIYVINQRQIRLALTAVGLREQVEAIVAASDQATKDWYEWSPTFERYNERVVATGRALNQTEEQMDALFTLGDTL